jgi:hypothetical protein
VPAFNFTDKQVNIVFSFRESNVLGRPNLALDKSRLLSFELVDFPGMQALGYRTSKSSILNRLLGQYRSGNKQLLALGSLKGKGQALKISISHPSIDEIWVCGEQVNELQVQLTKFVSKK